MLEVDNDDPEECRDVTEELGCLVEKGGCPLGVESMPSLSEGGVLWLFNEFDGGPGLCPDMGGFCVLITVNPLGLFDVRG